MMSEEGSALSGTLETEEVKREHFVNRVTIYKTRLDKPTQRSTESRGRKAGAEEKEGQHSQMKGRYISRSNKQKLIKDESSRHHESNINI